MCGTRIFTKLAKLGNPPFIEAEKMASESNGKPRKNYCNPCHFKAASAPAYLKFPFGWNSTTLHPKHTPAIPIMHQMFQVSPWTNGYQMYIAKHWLRSVNNPISKSQTWTQTLRTHTNHQRFFFLSWPSHKGPHNAPNKTNGNDRLRDPEKVREIWEIVEPIELVSFVVVPGPQAGVASKQPSRCIPAVSSSVETKVWRWAKHLQMLHCDV